MNISTGDKPADRIQLVISLYLAVPLVLLLVAGCRPASTPDSYALKPERHGTGWVSDTHYIGPLPKQAAQLRPGQEFLCLQPDEFAPAQPPFFDAVTGKSVNAYKLCLRVFTLQSVTPRTSAPPAQLTFTINHSQRKLTLASNADVDQLPWLIPLLDDATLDALRHRYEGNLVWCYGGCSTQHDGGITAVADDSHTSISVITPVLLPVRIRRIVRLDKLRRHVTSGSFASGGSANFQELDFEADRPLLVVLDTPNAAYGGANFQSLTPAEARRHLLGTDITCADTWDFQQHFSLKPPGEEHLDWSHAVLQDIADGNIQIGETHDMVAWTLGWPSYLETQTQSRAALTWVYDNGMYGYTLRFDKRGKVADINEGIPP